MPPPDAQLFPHATGAAEKMVKEHEKEEPLKLYSGWFCPFVQRVLLVLLEKKIPFQYIEPKLKFPTNNKVNPYHKPESLLTLNPRGLVPTLQYDDKPLYESTVICEFLEDAYPDAPPYLLPADPYTRARSRIWTDFVTSRIIPAYHRYLQYQGEEGDDGLQSVQTAFLATLKQFAEAMDPQGPFFLGPELAMVDLIMAPWAVRLWVFDQFKGGLHIPEGGPDEKVWKRWRAWVEAVEKRPSVVETTSLREHYLPIYQRYADDTAQSELAKATRQGKGVP
ncbi:Glutathione S-transferase omega-1 [Phlyctema vagabunda]|uniref:Glutathione S-transferase omega-1 n=1 Tax=Phlyctema vagabunda TaxID=108571 RepID=A0ABR4PXG4_9HELO